MSSTSHAPPSGTSSSSPSPLGPDNRCCFCLTLRSGSILVAVINVLLMIVAYNWYSASQDSRLSNLNISIFAVFALQLITDALLIYGAVKKNPYHTVPWLCSNAVLMGGLMVLLTIFLFLGYVKLSLSYNDYVTVLSCLAVVTGGHLFCFLVVFQFRKNLLEEINMGIITLGVIHNGPSAPDLEDMPQRYIRPPSPPPTYEEASKSVKKVDTAETCKIDLDTEAPPEYGTALALVGDVKNGKETLQKKSNPDESPKDDSFYVEVNGDHPAGDSHASEC